MTQDELIDDFEIRNTVSMAKYTAYTKVVDTIKCLQESSMKAAKEAKMALEKAGGDEEANHKLRLKVQQTKAACDAYTDACILVGKVALECKEKMMREMKEFNKLMEEV